MYEVLLAFKNSIYSNNAFFAQKMANKCSFHSLLFPQKKAILDAMLRESHPPAFYHYMTFALHNTVKDKGPAHADPYIAYPLLTLVRPLATLLQTR